MASTYSDLKIELMADGENTGTWGQVTNTNLGVALEDAIAGTANVAFSSANVTLTYTNTNGAQEFRNLRLVLTGTAGAPRDLIVPAVSKQYLIDNQTNDVITVKNSTGTGVAVPVGKKVHVFNDGTNVVDSVTHLSSLTLAAPLPVTSGGTGGSTAGDARTALGLGTIATQDASSVTLTGGTISGITDLAIADGGTGSSTAAGAFTNIKQAATESSTGVVEKATTAEAEAGTADKFPDAAGVLASITANSAAALVKSSTAEAEAGVNDATYMTPLKTNQAVAATTSIVRLTGAQTLLSKTMTNQTVVNYTEQVHSHTGGLTIGLQNGTIQIITTTGANNITLPTSVAGKSFIVIIKFAGAHSPNLLGGGSTLKWADGDVPVMTAVNGKFDIFSFFQDGVNTYGSIIGQNF